MKTFYPISVQAIRLRATREVEDPDKLLWMCEQIETMTNPYKAARWIGWMYHAAETKGWWDNSYSRDLARADTANGDDR